MANRKNMEGNLEQCNHPVGAAKVKTSCPVFEKDSSKDWPLVKQRRT